jgi:hypothetical protein
VKDDEGLWWGTFTDDRRGGGRPAVGGAIKRAARGAVNDRRSSDTVVNVAEAFMRRER